MEDITDLGEGPGARPAGPSGVQGFPIAVGALLAFLLWSVAGPEAPPASGGAPASEAPAGARPGGAGAALDLPTLVGEASSRAGEVARVRGLVIERGRRLGGYRVVLAEGEETRVVAEVPETVARDQVHFEQLAPLLQELELEGMVEVREGGAVALAPAFLLDGEGRRRYHPAPPRPGTMDLTPTGWAAAWRPLRVGRAHEGRPAPQVEAEDLPALRRDAQAGDLEARFVLAWLHAAGKHVRPDPEKALALLDAAAAEGHEEAAVQAGVLALGTKYAPGDPARALPLLRRAAEAGHIEAMGILGAYLLERDGRQAPGEALAWLRKASEAGHPAAARSLGGWLLLGNQSDEELAEAEVHLRRAVALGHGTALEMLERLASSLGKSALPPGGPIEDCAGPPPVLDEVAIHAAVAAGEVGRRVILRGAPSRPKVWPGGRRVALLVKSSYPGVVVFLRAGAPGHATFEQARGRPVVYVDGWLEVEGNLPYLADAIFRTAADVRSLAGCP